MSASVQVRTRRFDGIQRAGKGASLDWRPLRVCLCNGDRSDSASIPVHQRDRPSSERELVVVKKDAIDGAMPHPF